MPFFQQLSSFFCFRSEDPVSGPQDSLPQPEPPVEENVVVTAAVRPSGRDAALPDFAVAVTRYLTQLDSKEYDAESLGRILNAIIVVFDEENVRFELVSCITSHLRKSYKESTIHFLHLLVYYNLTEQEREILRNTLLHLPPGVLGDQEEQEKSRVFVDALKETRASIQMHRKAFSRMNKYKNHSAFLEKMMSTIVTALTDPTISNEDRMKSHASLANCFTCNLSRQSLVFQQIILSQELHASLSVRVDDVASIMDEEERSLAP